MSKKEETHLVPMQWEGATPYEVLMNHVPFPQAVHFAAILCGYAPKEATPDSKEVLEYASKIMHVSHKWAHIIPGSYGLSIDITKNQLPTSYPVTLVQYGIETIK